MAFQNRMISLILANKPTEMKQLGSGNWFIRIRYLYMFEIKRKEKFVKIDLINFKFKKDICTCRDQCNIMRLGMLRKSLVF